MEVQMIRYNNHQEEEDWAQRKNTPISTAICGSRTKSY